MKEKIRTLRLTQVLTVIAALALGLGLFSVPGVQASATITVCDSGCDHTTIQAAIIAAAPGDTINVAAGTYAGNVVVNKNISLVGAGSDTTIIDGNNAGGELGTIQLTTGRSGVLIQGFHIKGIDNSDPGLEKAAIYLQGVQTNITIQDNIIEARGDAALMGEWNAANNGITIHNNEFTGQTFNGAEPATGNQFEVPNVARQAIVFGGGAGTTNTQNFVFTDNVIATIAAGTSNGNTLVTLDLVGTNVISGNTFSGKSSAHALRVRGSGSYAINQNSFTGAYPLAIFRQGSDVNGNANYWGTPNPNFGSLVSGSVTIETWYVDAEMTTLASSLPVENVTQNTFYATIQAAIDAATAGDTINVAAGTYTENVTVNKSVSLLGAQAGVDVGSRSALSNAESILNGEIVITNVSGVTIDGFTITNPGGARALYLNNGDGNTPVNNVQITNNFITDVGSATNCLNVHVIYFNRGSNNVTIDGNHFSSLRANRSVSAIGVLDSAATVSSENLIIKNNIIEDVASVQSGTCAASPRGAYGILINNGAGAPDVQIIGNSLSGLSGAWTHAVGLEGPTPGALVINNSFENLTAVGADNAAVFVEDNPTGEDALIAFNRFVGSGFFGVALHPKHLPGGGGPEYMYDINAINNWWGSASGPGGAGPGTGASVTPNVDFDPWLGADVSEVNNTTLAPSETLDGPDGSSATNNGPGSFLVILSKFIGNPTNVPNFAGASAFYDIFVSGAGPDDSLDVELPAAGDGVLFYYDGSQWAAVLDGNGDPIEPDGGFYTFTLDANSIPTLESLNGTYFAGGGQEEIRITPSRDTSGAPEEAIAAGETFQVVVDAGSARLYGVDVSMTFDENLLEVTGIALGQGSAPKGLQAETVARNEYNNSAGTLRFAYSQRAPTPEVENDTEVVLATITFLAKADGVAQIALGNVLFTDKDGTPATPGPLNNPIELTIDPSPSVVAQVELQGRTNWSGASLQLVPTDTGNVLIDPSSTATGDLGYDPVPAAEYDVTIDAPLYLAAKKTVEIVPGNAVVDLTAPDALRLLGGDINGDGRINIQDLVIIGVNFNNPVTPGTVADINADGVVNIQDLAIAAGNFGEETPDYSW